MVRVAQKGEAEERPGLGIPREDLLQGPVPDEHGLGIRGTQRRDQAARRRLRIADPQEPVAARDNLLRAPVGSPCRGGHQRPCGGVVRLGDGGGKQRAEFAMLHTHRRREPPRQRPQRAGADRRAGRSAKPEAACGRVRHHSPRAARGQRLVEDPGGVLWIDDEAPSRVVPGPCRRARRLLPPARHQVSTFTCRVRHDVAPLRLPAAGVASRGLATRSSPAVAGPPQRPPDARRAQPNVQPRPHRADIDEVVAQLGPRRHAPAPAGLGETRDAGPHGEPPCETGTPALDPRRKLRALGARTHQAHLAAQHVDDLRQLVEMESAQHPAHGRRARIARLRPHRPGPPLGILGHGAELQHRENPSAAPQPGLAVQHAATVLQPDRRRDRHPQHQPQRAERHERERERDQVERSLVAVAARARRCGRVHLRPGQDPVRTIRAPPPGQPWRQRRPRMVHDRRRFGPRAHRFRYGRTEWRATPRALTRQRARAAARRGHGHSFHALQSRGYRHALMRYRTPPPGTAHVPCAGS